MDIEIGRGKTARRAYGLDEIAIVPSRRTRDPEDVDTWAVSPRGAGWLFGDKVSSEFNHVNGLQLIARPFDHSRSNVPAKPTGTS